MEITLELDGSLAASLQTAALVNGESAAEYVRVAVARRVAEEPEAGPGDVEERSRRITEALRQLQSAGATLGRNGKPWREFIHEGHTR